MILETWLWHTPADLLLRIPLGVCGAGVLAMILGRRYGRLAWTQGGVLALTWPIAIILSDAALVLGVEPLADDSPHRPSGVGAPLLGASLLVGAAVGGALARRWRPWPGLWLASAAASALAVGVTCWGQLDRTVLPVLQLHPSCMPWFYSVADDTWQLGQLWWVVAAAGGVAAVLAAEAGARLPSTTLRVAAEILLFGALGLTGLAAWKGWTAPAPDDYVASLPVVAVARPDGPATLAEMGLGTPERLTRERHLFGRPEDWSPPPWTRYTFTGAAPAGFTLYYDPTGAYATLLWRWADEPSSEAPLHGQDPTPVVGEQIQLLRDERSDLWLITSEGRALALVDKALDQSWPNEFTEQALWRRFVDRLVPWTRIAHEIAPPTAWTLGAVLSVLTALVLRRERAPTESAARTLAAMRIAALSAGCTPLLVAAWRGFVLPR